MWARLKAERASGQEIGVPVLPVPPPPPHPISDIAIINRKECLNEFDIFRVSISVTPRLIRRYQ
jgi:hypothetical protein